MHELSTYKRNLKPSILSEAIKSFREYGIRAVKMDDIAKNLGISKRTLYEVYSNKEEVLVDVVKTLLKEREDRLRNFVSECDNVLDILLEVLRLQIEFSAKTNIDFFKDLSKYPVVDNLIMKFDKEQEKASSDFFNRGVEQGYFRSEVDYKIFHRITSGVMRMLRVDATYADLTYQQLFVNYLSIIIIGVCTEKGHARFDVFLKQYFK